MNIKEEWKKLSDHVSRVQSLQCEIAKLQQEESALCRKITLLNKIKAWEGDLGYYETEHSDCYRIQSVTPFVRSAYLYRNVAINHSYGLRINEVFDGQWLYQGDEFVGFFAKDAAINKAKYWVCYGLLEDERGNKLQSKFAQKNA